MTEKRWNWGIIGSGKIASDFVASLEFAPEANVVAVGARDKKDAEAFAKKFPNYAITPYGSYQDVVSDPKVEIVYITTLHPLHKEGAILALNHNKHVLIEKPITINGKELEQILQVAKAKNLFVMEAMWTRFIPAICKVREIISSGEIGDVVLVNADMGFNAPYIPRLMEPELGGGALLDIGVYVIALASMVLGPKLPEKILGQSTPLKTGPDATTVIQLAYPSGKFANLSVTLRSVTPCEAWICGTKGRIKICSPFWCSMKIIVCKEGEQEKELEFPLPHSNHTFNFKNSVGLHHQAKHVMERLNQGHKESNIISTAESQVVMEIMDEIRRQIGLKYPQEK